MTHRTLLFTLLVAGLSLTSATALAQSKKKKAKPLSCKSKVAKKIAANHIATLLNKKKKPYAQQPSWPKPADTLDLTKKAAKTLNVNLDEHSSFLFLHTNKSLNLFVQSFASFSNIYTCTYAIPSPDRVPQFTELSLIRRNRAQPALPGTNAGLKIKRTPNKTTATIAFVVPQGKASLMISAKAQKR